MARDPYAAGGLRRFVTVVVALLVLGLVVIGGTTLQAQQPAARPVAATASGRTAIVCTVGAVPEASATPTPEPSASVSAGVTPTPGTTPSITPTPSVPAPAPAPTPTPSPTASAAPSQAVAPGDVAVVASGPVPTASPADAGRVTASRLGSDKTDLTVDQQGQGATLERAAAPVLLLAEGAMAPTASGAVLSVNTSGPESGLAAAPCSAPTTSAWFPGIGSSAVDRTELVLSNADDAAAEVDLRFYGRRGRVVVPGSPAIAVAARSSRSVSLSSLVDVEGPLTVEVQATAGRVSAAARRIRAAGTRPAGADWVVPAAAPALTAVVPGVPGEDGSRELVVTNPGTSRAVVQVQVLGLQGPYAPVGAESLALPPESAGTVELREGLAGGAAGVKITSDQPVTAAVTATSSRTGALPDIAVQAASVPLVRTGVGAVATSDAADAELVLSNGAESDVTVSFDVLSYAGVMLRTDEVLLAANGTATRRLNSPAPSYVVVRVPDDSAVVGGVVLTGSRGAVSSSVAGLSTIPLTSPDAAGRTPQVTFDPAAGR